MHEIKVDDKENRIYPHPKIIEAYLDENKGNGFPRVRRAEDDTYEKFYNACRKNKFYCQAKTIVRTRTIKDGKLKEIIYFFAHVKGTNSAGIEEEYPTWFGVYDEPIFSKHLNKESDNFEVDGVRDNVRKYEFEATKENIDKIFEYADDATVLMVKESPEIVAGFPISDIDGFKAGNYNQLIEMGKQKRTLKDIIEMSKNTIAEAKKQAEIAKAVGEPESAKEILDVADVAEVKVTKTKGKKNK